jgi:hypothetical protein
MAGLARRVTFIFRAANSKAGSTLAATARTLRRKIRFRDIDLVSLISLILGPSIAPPHSGKNQFLLQAPSLRGPRAARSPPPPDRAETNVGTRSAGCFLRSVDCHANPRSLARKPAFVLRLQSNFQFTERGHQPLAKDVERIRFSAIGRHQ